MTFGRALERSLSRAEMIRDLALREGDLGKARAWELIANSRWRRLKGEAIGAQESPENGTLADEERHHAPVDFQVEAELVTGHDGTPAGD